MKSLIRSMIMGKCSVECLTGDGDIVSVSVIES